MSGVSYPFLTETIPLYAVILLGIFPSLIIITGSEIFNHLVLLREENALDTGRQRIRRFIVNMYHTLALFAFGLGVTLLFTEILKKMVGKYFLSDKIIVEIFRIMRAFVKFSRSVQKPFESLFLEL
jgi:hypothetical protein